MTPTTTETLLPILVRYFEDDPASAAKNLEALDEEVVSEVLSTLPSAVAAEVFSRLHATFAARIILLLSQDTVGKLLERIDPLHASSIFLSLPEETRQHFVDSLPPRVLGPVKELLSFPEDSAGRIMRPDFLALQLTTTVEAAVQKLRQLARRLAPASYVYVVDEDNHLVGVINMRDLMLAYPDQRLEQVMRKDVFSVHAFTDREQVLQELSEKRFFAVPVVDSENRLLGIIKAENLLTGAQAEATEDFQKMFGAGGDERAFSPIKFSLKKRLPWLHVNLATAFLAAFVVAIFEDIIAKITVLAVLLPVVAGQGGNAGAQSLAVVMRGLVMREIPPEKVKKLVLKETAIGAINGVVVGLVTAVIAGFWQGKAVLGLVIGLGMFVNLVVAGFSGAFIPIAMKWIGLDPAQCSNIILTTITDVMGFFSFLGFAVLFQGFLL